MASLLLDPHGDDAALFACYTVGRVKPVVVIPNMTCPYDEVDRAMWVMGVERVLHGFPKALPDHVYAPAIHEDGHEEHNSYSQEVINRYQSKGIPVTWYTTYAPRGVRTRGSVEVIPDEPRFVAVKLRALSCFVSQIEQESTRPWFTSLLDLREWTM